MKNSKLDKLFDSYEGNLLNYFCGLTPKESKQFNKIIIDYIDSKCDYRLYYLHFDIFVDVQRQVLKDDLGRFNNPYDQIHLGSQGVRLLVKLIKERKLKYQNKLERDTMEQINYIENRHGPFPDPGDYSLDADEMAEVIPKWQGKASGGSVNYYDDYLPDIDDMDY